MYSQRLGRRKKANANYGRCTPRLVNDLHNNIINCKNLIFFTSKSTTIEYALMIAGFKAMARGMLQTQKKEKLISMLVTAGITSYFNHRNKNRLRL